MLVPGKLYQLSPMVYPGHETFATFPIDYNYDPKRIMSNSREIIFLLLAVEKGLVKGSDFDKLKILLPCGTIGYSYFRPNDLIVTEKR